jgi:hypothetical protein
MRSLVLPVIAALTIVSAPQDAILASEAGAATAQEYACKNLLPDSARLLLALLDPWTGLPYDQIPCRPDPAGGLPGVNRAWGVIPQLAYASIDTFAEDPARLDSTVESSFTDQGPQGAPPTLLWALRLELHLSAPGDGNAFGGLTWGGNADVRRYRWLRIRYATGSPDTTWELKINSGQNLPESVVELEGSLPGKWREERFELSKRFSGINVQQINRLVLASHSGNGQRNPVLIVDQISFEADPAQRASCASFCSEPLPAYPDLACYEPFTGAVNIANALTSLSLLPEAGLLSRKVAEPKVARILQTLGSFPVHRGFRAFFQDWHSPVSGMPDPRNRIASLTDQPQLYAALMVVEKTWPKQAVRAAALRRKLDFSKLVETSNGCCLNWAVDRCGGVQSGCLEYVGTDSLLGSFLALASGGAPLCTWQRLDEKGCDLDGPANAPWYTTAGPEACSNALIPAIGNGGPFLQLAGLQYLKSPSVPLGSLSLAASAGNMLKAQADYASRNGLTLAGWTSASDPAACAYSTCEDFLPERVTPYIWAMGLDLRRRQASSFLQKFHQMGVDQPLDTGSLRRSFGLRDAWDQDTGTGRDAYLYLDTGWSVLGLLNACHGSLVRNRFGAHPVAVKGYRVLQKAEPLCLRP